MSVILHKVLSSSLDQDLTRSCISFQAFSLASLMSACSLCTSSTCLLSTSMFRVGFFSCEYNTVWFKKALTAHHSQWSLSFLSPAVPLRWWYDPAVSAFLHNYWNLKVYRFEKDTRFICFTCCTLPGKQLEGDYTRLTLRIRRKEQWKLFVR